MNTQTTTNNTTTTSSGGNIGERGGNVIKNAVSGVYLTQQAFTIAVQWC